MISDDSLFNPSLISLVVSVDVKHHVYLLAFLNEMRASLIVRGKVSRQSLHIIQTANLEERRAEAESNLGPSVYQPDALPLGQTGSRVTVVFDGR